MEGGPWREDRRIEQEGPWCGHASGPHLGSSEVESDGFPMASGYNGYSVGKVSRCQHRFGARVHPETCDPITTRIGTRIGVA